MITAAIVTIWDPKFATILQPDVSLYAQSIEYGFDPNGCAAAAIQTNLTLEQMESAPIIGGAFSARNGVEIKTLDDQTTAPIAAASASSPNAKIYVTDLRPYDPTRQYEIGSVDIFDGQIMVVGNEIVQTGSDSGGPFIVTKPPIAAPGNPAYMPAFGAGAGIYRRRWAGRVARRTWYKDGSAKKAIIACNGIGKRLGECVVNFAANSLDAGAAIYALIFNQASRFTDLDLAAMTQATVGSTYSGTSTQAFVSDVITQILAAIPGDIWTVRVGSDRVPRMVKLYSATPNTYSVVVSLSQHATRFVPMDVESDDQDTSSMANAILIQGDANAQSGTPITAAAGDELSVATYGQIDGSPQTVTGIKDQTMGGQVAEGLLARTAYPQQSTSFKLFVKNASSFVAGDRPIGLANGDVVSGFEAVQLTGFDQTNEGPNAAIDSGLMLANTTPDTLWTFPTGITLGASPLAATEFVFRIPATSGGAASGPVIPVAPGTVWSFSGWINASGTPVDTAAEWLVYTTEATPRLLGTAKAVPGTSGRFSAQPFTIPSGVYTIFVEATVRATSGDAATIYFGQPMLNWGLQGKAYVPNLAAPKIYGLPSSVVCHMDAGGDRTQAVTFAPVEPDVNEIIREQAHATANAILTNTRAGVGVTKFIVSPEAEDYAFSATSLTIAFPAFKALFDRGTPQITVAAQNVTLQPWGTTHVWLLPDATFTTRFNDPTTVVGAILMGYFTTNAAGVIGHFERISYGFFESGVGNADPSLLFPAPTFSSATVSPGASLNGIAADIDTSIALSNVPTDGSATSVEYYYRTSVASGSPNAWIAVDGANLARTSAGTASGPDQTVGFSYGMMTKGASYDLGVGYRGASGYGPIAVFASNFVAPLLAIGAPYMLGGKPVTPTFSATSVANGPSANNITADLEVSATASNQPTDGSLWRVNFWVRPTAVANDGTAGAMTPGDPNCRWAPRDGLAAIGSGLMSPPASGAYQTSISDVTGGTTVDVGMSYENTQRGQSDIGVIARGFATVVVQLTAAQTSFEAIVNGGFYGLAEGANGFLLMETAQDIYPSKLPFSVDLRYPYYHRTDAQFAAAKQNSVAIKMRFQLSDARTHPAIAFLTDAAANGTTFQNGYFAQWVTNAAGTGSVLLYKRVAGTNIFLGESNFENYYFQAPLDPLDTQFHTFEVRVSPGGFGRALGEPLENPYGSGAGPGPASIAFFFLVDGVGGGALGECYFQTGDPDPNSAGAKAESIRYNIGGVPPFLSGRCGPAARDFAAPVALDPKGLELDSSVGTFYEDPSQNSSENIIFNPTAALGTDGWATYVVPGTTATFGYDSYKGGRFIINVSGGSSNSGAVFQQSLATIPPAGEQRVVAGLFHTGNLPNAGSALSGTVLVDIEDPTTQTILGSSPTLSTLLAGPIPFSFPYVATGHALLLRLRCANGSNVSGCFYRLSDTAGTLPPFSYKDSTSAALTTKTHTATADARNSYLASDTVNQNQIDGLPNTAQPLGDGTNLNHSIMSSGVQLGVLGSGQLIGIGQSSSTSGSTPSYEQDNGSTTKESTVSYTFSFTLPAKADGSGASYNLEFEWNVNVSANVGIDFTPGSGIGTVAKMYNNPVGSAQFAFAKLTATAASGTYSITAIASYLGNGIWALTTPGVVTIKATRYA